MCLWIVTEVEHDVISTLVNAMAQGLSMDVLYEPLVVHIGLSEERATYLHSRTFLCFHWALICSIQGVCRLRRWFAISWKVWNLNVQEAWIITVRFLTKSELGLAPAYWDSSCERFWVSKRVFATRELLDVCRHALRYYIARVFTLWLGCFISFLVRNVDLPLLLLERGFEWDVLLVVNRRYAVSQTQLLCSLHVSFKAVWLSTLTAL